MPKLKLYLDNCCYNRPYDDQSYINVSLETQAKLFIQKLIRNGKVDMVSSYILVYENGCNPFNNRRNSVSEFLRNAVDFVGIEKSGEVKALASEIMRTGVKPKDSLHVASAIISGCDIFISTDYRLLKYKTDKIKMMNPIEFVTEYANLFPQDLEV